MAARPLGPHAGQHAAGVTGQPNDARRGNQSDRRSKLVVIAAKTSDPHPKLPGTIHSVATEVEQAGGEALALQLDVRDEAAIGAAIAQAAARFGGSAGHTLPQRGPFRDKGDDVVGPARYEIANRDKAAVGADDAGARRTMCLERADPHAYAVPSTGGAGRSVAQALNARLRLTVTSGREDTRPAP